MQCWQRYPGSSDEGQPELPEFFRRLLQVMNVKKEDMTLAEECIEDEIRFFPQASNPRAGKNKHFRP